MGREVTCKCKWAGVTMEVKALLESGTLILRGGRRKSVPLSELGDVNVQADQLCFSVDGEPVQLFLGRVTADKWAAAIKTPPPALSRKLGITNKSIVRTIGSIRDEALRSALAEAARISESGNDLIVACVDTPESVHAALREVKAQLLRGIPIWMVYAKGPGRALSESSIRSLLLAEGMVDTKVAAVSPALTALRFSRRKSSA